MLPREDSASSEAELLRRTHDLLPSSVVTVDPDGVVIYTNATAREMVPTVGVGVELRPTLEQLTHVEKVDRLLIRREIVTFAATEDGPELHWIVWGNPGEDGVEVLTVWESDWNENMTERRAAFMMAASHELRGPLTALKGFAEILNMDTSNLTREQAEATAIIESTARHLTILVEDVFDLSRNSFGELRLNPCEIDLGEVIESVASTLRTRVEEREQTLSVEIAGDLPTISADRARATQMISNLVSNASIHNPENTTIGVRATVVDGSIAVEVADDGDGLPFDDPEEAFHSFRRGESATAGDRAGSGIGLSITKRLIELHRGTVSVESDPGAGSRFTLYFPIERESALAPGRPGPV